MKKRVPAALSVLGALVLTGGFIAPGSSAPSSVRIQENPAPSAFQRDVTEATFQREVIQESQKRVVVIDFMTKWCGGCKEVKPHLVEKAGKDRYWLLAFVDAEANRGIASHIRKYPTFEAYYQGKIVSRFDRDNFEISDMLGWIDQTVKSANNGTIPAPGADPDLPPPAPAPSPTATNTNPAPKPPGPKPTRPPWPLPTRP